MYDQMQIYTTGTERKEGHTMPTPEQLRGITALPDYTPARF